MRARGRVLLAPWSPPLPSSSLSLSLSPLPAGFESSTGADTSSPPALRAHRCPVVAHSAGLNQSADFTSQRRPVSTRRHLLHRPLPGFAFPPRMRGRPMQPARTPPGGGGRGARGGCPSVGTKWRFLCLLSTVWASIHHLGKSTIWELSLAALTGKNDWGASNDQQ